MIKRKREKREVGQTYIYVYIYIYIERERKREREAERKKGQKREKDVIYINWVAYIYFGPKAYLSLNAKFMILSFLRRIPCARVK